MKANKVSLDLKAPEYIASLLVLGSWALILIIIIWLGL